MIQTTITMMSSRKRAWIQMMKKKMAGQFSFQIQFTLAKEFYENGATLTSGYITQNETSHLDILHCEGPMIQPVKQI